jgi:glycosyltransferase involved in cell wall biosynthesis
MNQLPPILLMTYSLEAGGSERQASAMALGLHRRGWPVHFACLRAQGQFVDSLRDAGIPVVEFPVRSFRSPACIPHGLRFRRYLREHGIRLAHAFDAPSRLLLVPFGRLARLPAVLTSHRGSLTFFDNQRFLRSAIRLMDRWADGVVANCGAMAQELRELAGLNESRIHLNYNGIDPDVYASGPTSPEEFVIGSVGALRPEKDFLSLVNAFAMVHREFPQVRLLLVGSGEDHARLAARINELEIASVTRLEPETRDVPGWLRQLSIFVLPSLTEAFSNSLMEAMSCARACVASRVGGNPELIGDESEGLLFEAGNATDLAAQLRRLILDPALRQRLAAAARDKIVREFSLDAATARLDAIYRQHLGLPQERSQVSKT